jgi:hypothetical protein
MVYIFALAAESLRALHAKEDAIVALRLFTNVAVAEMAPFGKVVTVSAPDLTNLGHFAVCALLFGLSKSRTVIFTKASMQAKSLGKLLYLHETSDGSSIQKSEHRAAHEIFRKHLGDKHGWIARMLLRLL